MQPRETTAATLFRHRGTCFAFADVLGDRLTAGDHMRWDHAGRRRHDLLGYAIDLDVSYRVAIDAAAELPMIVEEETWHDATSCGGEA